MAFRKPVAIEGWKDARAMETSTAHRRCGRRQRGFMAWSMPSGRKEKIGRRTRPYAHELTMRGAGLTRRARTQTIFSRSRSAVGAQLVRRVYHEQQAGPHAHHWPIIMEAAAAMEDSHGGRGCWTRVRAAVVREWF